MAETMKINHDYHIHIALSSSVFVPRQTTQFFIYKKEPAFAERSKGHSASVGYILSYISILKRGTTDLLLKNFTKQRGV